MGFYEQPLLTRSGKEGAHLSDHSAVVCTTTNCFLCFPLQVPATAGHYESQQKKEKLSAGLASATKNNMHFLPRCSRLLTERPINSLTITQKFTCQESNNRRLPVQSPKGTRVATLELHRCMRLPHTSRPQFHRLTRQSQQTHQAHNILMSDANFCLQNQAGTCRW